MHWIQRSHEVSRRHPLHLRALPVARCEAKVKVFIDKGINPVRLRDLFVGELVAQDTPDGRIGVACAPGGNNDGFATNVLDLERGIYYALETNAQNATLYRLPPNVTVTLQNKA
jgi:hypothetical protein